jgi:hypothetical protein
MASAPIAGTVQYRLMEKNEVVPQETLAKKSVFVQKYHKSRSFDCIHRTFVGIPSTRALE